MMFKRVFIMLLGSILLLSLCSCGGEDSPDIDYESNELQAVSSERATEATLVSTYHDWFYGELDAAAQSELTYKDFVAQIGCEASWYNALSDYRVYTWEAEGDPSVKIGATFENNDGTWKCKYFNGNNIGAAL